MASDESTQHKLDRIRAPRVQITYDLQKDGVMEKKELPYVVGVIGDFTGHPDPDKERVRLKDRKLVSIDRDNFNDVLKAMEPRLTLEVDNTLKADNSTMKIALRFQRLQDFEPEQLVRQIEPLNKLLIARQRLQDLRNKMAGNEQLEEELQKILDSTELLQQLGEQTQNGTEGEAH